MTLHPARHQPRSRGSSVYLGDYIPATLPNSRPGSRNRRGLPLHDWAGLLVTAGPGSPDTGRYPPAPDGDCGQLDALTGLHDCGYPAGSRSCRLTCEREA